MTWQVTCMLLAHASQTNKTFPIHKVFLKQKEIFFYYYFYEFIKKFNNFNFSFELYTFMVSFLL